MSKSAKMTLANESITFTPEGIWIQPILSDRFLFAGSPSDLISLMIQHTELDINTAKFWVTVLFDSPYFCGFCRGYCKGEHYISDSTRGY